MQLCEAGGGAVEQNALECSDSLDEASRSIVFAIFSTFPKLVENSQL